MIHRDEPVLFQTLVAELAVEALDVLVLDRLARPDERQANVCFYGEVGPVGVASGRYCV